VACPDATVIATVGDGTFGFHAMELETAIRYDLPVVIVVGNDACWNAEYQIQLADYGAERLIGCELSDTRYDELCRSLGGWGERVERAEDLSGALRRAVESGQPAVVDVRIDRVRAPIVRR
jgi:acetolactate synthase-1/2/3 large subunit